MFSSENSLLRICTSAIRRDHGDGSGAAAEFPEWLQEFREILVDDEIPVHGGSHASSSHEVSLEPTFKRREELGKPVFTLISLKNEIARSVRGLKFQGPRAEDAMAEPYLVLKIMMT